MLRERIVAASRPPVPVLCAIEVTGPKQYVQERTLAIQRKKHFELMTLEGVTVLKEGKGRSWALGLTSETCGNQTSWAGRRELGEADRPAVFPVLKGSFCVFAFPAVQDPPKTTPESPSFLSLRMSRDSEALT